MHSAVLAPDSKGQPVGQAIGYFGTHAVDETAIAYALREIVIGGHWRPLIHTWASKSKAFGTDSPGLAPCKDCLRTVS